MIPIQKYIRFQLLKGRHSADDTDIRERETNIENKYEPL